MYSIPHPVLFSVGVNHKSAPLEVREKVYIHEKDIPALLNRLKDKTQEAIVLSTCNRTELYGVTSAENLDTDYFKELIIDFNRSGGYVRKEHFSNYISCSSAHQLFKVAASIDSQIIGDSQILQQLKNAYYIAKENNSTGKILNQLSQRALKVGKRAKSETEIHKGAASISLAAVELALKIFSDLKDKSILIIGAGETVKLTAKALINKNVNTLFITNRTRAHAEDMIDHLRGHSFTDYNILDYAIYKHNLSNFDIIISSTSSPNFILFREELENAVRIRSGKPILIVDIGMPRDVDPEAGSVDNIILRNMEDLNDIVDSNFEKRMMHIPLVKKIIMKELMEYLIWYYSLPLMPSIKKIDKKIDRGKKIEEMKKLRAFLTTNVSNLHRSMSHNKSSDIKEDLKNHFVLIRKLYEMNNSNNEEIIIEE